MSRHGGAISASNSISVSIHGCTFTSNGEGDCNIHGNFIHSYRGGAIYTVNCTTITIILYNSTFTHNGMKYNTGGAMFVGSESRSVGNVTNSVFTSNTALSGGEAIHAQINTFGRSDFKVLIKA